MRLVDADEIMEFPYNETSNAQLVNIAINDRMMMTLYIVGNKMGNVNIKDL